MPFLSEIHCPYVPVIDGLMTIEADRDNAIGTNVESFRDAIENSTFLYQWFTLNGINVYGVLFEEMVKCLY